MNKEDFLNNLRSMTIEQINNVIKSNGKEPKLINPVRIGKDEEYEKRIGI